MALLLHCRRVVSRASSRTLKVVGLPGSNVSKPCCVCDWLLLRFADVENVWVLSKGSCLLAGMLLLG
jgi:hypothetical protein